MTKERACKVKARALKIGRQSGTTWYQQGDSLAQGTQVRIFFCVPRATFPLPHYLAVSCYANKVQLYDVLTATAYFILGTYEYIIDYVQLPNGTTTTSAQRTLQE
jgi:hypothetical protein